MRLGGVLLKAYLLSLAGAILLSSLVSILVSDGKMGKFIKGMARLFLFSVLISPLFSLFGGRNPLGFSAAESADVAVSGDYLLVCAEMLEREDEAEIEAFLLKEYALEAKADMTREADGLFLRKKIRVEITNGGISEREPHIDMTEELRSVLEQKYGCEAEVIWRAEVQNS